MLEALVSGALEGLVAKGLLTRTAGEPAQLIASPPDIAGEVLLLRRMQEFHLARAAMGRLSAEYHSSGTADTAPEPRRHLEAMTLPHCHPAPSSRNGILSP
ncbi:hypothetical protein ACIQM4_25310 [Streptomyces sp. NPDC091272]|uniref:hypothetical protein n=1 Tax=Streptomyces sp. NPDC091272 TaxID=3365981 RepID=UPI00381DC0F0